MQIVEDEHEGHRAARFLEHAGDRAEQQVTVGLRVALRRRGDIGQPVIELRHEAHQVAAMALHVLAQDVLARLRDVVAERLDPGAVRRG